MQRMKKSTHLSLYAWNNPCQRTTSFSASCCYRSIIPLWGERGDKWLNSDSYKKNRQTWFASLEKQTPQCVRLKHRRGPGNRVRNTSTEWERLRPRQLPWGHFPQRALWGNHFPPWVQSKRPSSWFQEKVHFISGWKGFRDRKGA